MNPVTEVNGHRLAVARAAIELDNPGVAILVDADTVVAGLTVTGQATA